jgi:hypothetical protein
MGTPPRDDAPGTDDLRVITLASARTPMPLYVPFRHELEGFTVFRSRSGEGDSELYYLHVGYFGSELAAIQAREVIRRYYPFATIERAPRTGLGSLEDTLDADFQILAAARVVARRQAPPKPAAPKPAQRFAVLLARRTFPLDATPIPRLAEFEGFSVYAVLASGDGGDCQDVRLGFFQHVELARKFADSIRGHFPTAATIPVSEREYERVAGLRPGGGAVVRWGAPRPGTGPLVRPARQAPASTSPAQTFTR